MNIIKDGLIWKRLHIFNSINCGISGIFAAVTMFHFPPTILFSFISPRSL